jgi:hypothetical protein
MLSQEQPGGTFRPEDGTVPSDTGTVTGDQAEKEPGFLDTVGEYVGDAYDTVGEYVGDAYDTVGEYVGDAYDTVSEYVSETVDTLERVAESVGEKLRRLLGSEEEQSNTSVDNPPIPEPRPERRPVAVDNPPIPEPRPKQAVVDFSDVVDFVGTLKKAEGGSVEKEVEFVKEDDDDDDVPDPPPGATPEEVADDIPAYLSTGEYVLPANVVRYIGLKNITGMHQRALSELQQMEDLDIIENVDENGYVEEDDDEMDYMKPEGVVEIVVAEHHPKGLMAMGFAEGGPVEAMVYVPGVGFVPQSQAVYLSGTKDKDEKPKEQEDTDKSILEGGESQGDTNDTSEGGPTGEGYGSFSEMVNDPSFQNSAKSVIGLFGTALMADIVEGTVKGFKEEFGLNDLNEQIASDMAGATDDPGTTGAPGMGDTTGSGVGSGVEGGLGTTGGHDDGGEESAESAAPENEAEAAGLKRGGYVTRNGIRARGYSEGGMINSDSSIEEGQVLPTSDIFSEGVYAQADINRSVDSENVVESDKVITAPIAFSSAPGKTAYLAYITPEEAASLRQAKQGFSSEGNGQEVSEGQYQHLGPKGLMSFNGTGGPAASGGSDPMGGDDPANNDIGDPEDVSDPFGGHMGGRGSDVGDGHGGGSREYEEDLEPEEVEEEKPTDPYEGYTYVKGIGYVPTSRRATSIESASLSSIFTPGFLSTIGLMGDPNREL